MPAYSTALVPYDPRLPNISIKDHLEASSEVNALHLDAFAPLTGSHCSPHG